MTPLPIDLDAEAIQLEGHWYTRDELARKIKSMLDAGDFAIGKPSQALEQLNQTVSSLRTLAFRVTPEMADAINAIGAKHNRTVGSIIREALAMHLGLPPTPEVERVPPRRTTAPPGRRPTEPELPGNLPGPAGPPGLTPLPAETRPAPQVPQVIPGPGALKAASQPPSPPPPPVIVAGQPPPTVILDKTILPPELVSPPEPPAGSAASPAKRSDEEAVERRWFGA